MSATITLSNSYDLNLYVVTNRGLGVFVPANDSYDIVWEYPVEGESKGYLETFYNNTCNNVNNLLGDTYLTASYSIPSDWGTGGGGGGGGAVDSVNGKTGVVILNAGDVGALPDNTTIPRKTSELNNDSNFVADASYVHTDNNYDATAKAIVDGVTSNFVKKSLTAGLLKNDGTVDISKHVHLQPTGSEVTGEIQSKIWNGLTNFRGDYIWTDGDNIYYSKGSDQYVLDKSTSTWNTKSWSGLTDFNGNSIWTVGDNIYYSNGSSSSQYVLDKSTGTWSAKTWTGYTDIDGGNIWTDGDNIYWSVDSDHYVLDKSTSTWSAKTWSGLTSFYGGCVWTDGDNVYYSNGKNQYVLDKSTSTWNTKAWNGMSNFYGSSIWTDATNIYYSNGGNNYVLNKSTSTWNTKTWTGLTNFTGDYIWTDGYNTYYSISSDQYVFVSDPVYADGFVKTDGTIDTTKYAVVSDGGDVDVTGDMNISGTLQAENLIIPVNPLEQPSTAGSIWIEINE